MKKFNQMKRSLQIFSFPCKKKCYRNIISMTKIEQFTENMASITNSYWFAETFCHVYMSA